MQREDESGEGGKEGERERRVEERCGGEAGRRGRTRGEHGLVVLCLAELLVLRARGEGETGRSMLREGEKGRGGRTSVMRRLRAVLAALRDMAGGC